MSSQWKLVPVEPTETMVISGFESEPDECFTDEEVWEQFQAMSGCQQAAFRAKLCWAAMLAAAPVPPQAELDRAVAERGANPEPDPVLCKFYDVSDWPGLVRELVGHVAQLQDSAKRNVKPWEDTFPPTLLPAYIERVNSENSAAQPKGEQLACMPVERCYDVRAKMIIAFNEARKNGGDLDDALDAAYKSALRYSPNPLSAEQPAPVAASPINYGALDPVERLAVCRGDVAPVAVTLQQVLMAYDYAESHPHKYLRGTTNWCAAVAYKLNACLDELKRLNPSL